MPGINFYPLGDNSNTLTQWFIGIGRILNKKNYDNNTFIPSIIGLTGGTVSGTYIKKGPLCYFTTIVEGTSSTTNAYIENLIETSVNYGNCKIFNITDNSLIGNSYIDINTKKCFLPDWNVTSKKIFISGFYEIVGE
jgi:hypothetical protein